MAEPDFEALRLEYLTAIGAYTSQAARMAEFTKNGVRPPHNMLKDEEDTLYRFSAARRDFLDALERLTHIRPL